MMKNKNQLYALKGGCWYDIVKRVWSAYRVLDEPNNHDRYTGFRIKLEDVDD
jgi:formylglycine-generating enzyme required for sulfatase activity